MERGRVIWSRGRDWRETTRREKIIKSVHLQISLRNLKGLKICLGYYECVRLHLFCKLFCNVFCCTHISQNASCLPCLFKLISASFIMDFSLYNCQTQCKMASVERNPSKTWHLLLICHKPPSFCVKLIYSEQSSDNISFFFFFGLFFPPWSLFELLVYKALNGLDVSPYCFQDQNLTCRHIFYALFIRHKHQKVRR